MPSEIDPRPRPLRLTTMTSLLGLALALSGCDKAEQESPPAKVPANASRQAAPAEAAAAASDEPAALQTLFHDSLHDIEMPDPGQVRIEYAGKVHIVDLPKRPGCPVGPEAPDHGDFTAHSLQVHFTWTDHEGRELETVLQRGITFNEETMWPSTGHEYEHIHITYRIGGENKIDRYQMRRATPADEARLASGEAELPGIRIHSQGHQATFIGRVAPNPSRREEPLFDGELRIAIHCQ
jgi:hypothetical protein